MTEVACHILTDAVLLFWICYLIITKEDKR